MYDCHFLLHGKYVVVRVEMVPNRVIGEIVLDGGGHFIPADIFGVHTLSLLLPSYVAYDRATEDTRTHTGKEHQSLIQYKRHTRQGYIIIRLNVGTVHKPRQGGVNSVPL